MKTKIFNLIVLVLFSNCLFGQMKHIKMPNTDEGMVDVNIINQNTFIVAEQWANKIYTTNDEGHSWTSKTVNTAYPGSNQAISFIDENIGFVQTLELVNGGLFVGGTEVSNLYKTTDGGESWSLITPGGLDPETTSFWMGAMLFFNEDIGMANVNGVLWRTTDGGNSWTEVGQYPNSVTNDYNDTGTAYFTKKNHNATDGMAEVFHTNDFGATWNVINIEDVQSNFSQSKIAIIENIAYINFNSKLVILNDGEVQNIHELPFDPFVFVGGPNQTLIETTLTSTSPPAIKIELWNTFDYGENLTLVDAIEEEYIYLIESDYAINKGVLVGTQGDLIIFENIDITNSTLKLKQSSELNIYPNPAPIGQTINVSGDIQIGNTWKVRDRIGKVIQTGVVNNNNLIISNLDLSGIYFLEMHNGNELIIKKLIVQ